MLARAQQDAVWARGQAHNKLRSQLREFYPAILDAFAQHKHSLCSREARTILAAAPTPTMAAEADTATPADPAQAGRPSPRIRPTPKGSTRSPRRTADALVDPLVAAAAGLLGAWCPLRATDAGPASAVAVPRARAGAALGHAHHAFTGSTPRPRHHHALGRHEAGQTGVDHSMHRLRRPPRTRVST